MIFLFGFVMFVICSVVFYIWKERKWFIMYKQLHRIPWNIPLLGCAHFLTKDHELRMYAFQGFGRHAFKYGGGLTSLWIGPRYFIVVADASIAEILLKTCFAKDDVVHMIWELLGNGSIFAPIQIWRPRRKVVAPTFSMKNLNQFMGIFSQQSSTMVQQLKGAAGKGTFSVWKYLTTYTMDSVCESTLGVKVGAQRHPDQPFLNAFDQYCKMASERLLHPPIAHKAYKYLPKSKTYMKNITCMWDFVDSIIKIKRKELVERKIKSLQGNPNDTKEKPIQKTFLELLIESSGGASGFTNLELREESLVLLLAGTDTSAVGSAFTCLMLATHPDVQQKVYEEVMKELGDTDRAITAADLPKLKYLEAVVKETMRLYPPVPFIVRKVDKDLKLPSGVTIVNGTSIVVHICAVHRNPKYWGEDADEFHPDRFMGSNVLHTAAYIPFSHGPRSCLGYQYAMMSMKTAIANIVRHYRILPAAPVTNKNAPLRVKFDIMMKHVENFELQIESRT